MAGTEHKTDRVVVFDIGEVLSTPVTLFDDLAQALRSASFTGAADEVRQAYWVDRDLHDRGSAAHEYWGSVARHVGVGSADGDLLNRLSLIDSQAWANIRDDASDVMADLKLRGVKIAILSNAPVPMANAVRAAPWAVLVDEWFFSGELEVAKPDPEIYRIVTDKLAEEPGRIVFFDDRQVNVDAATALGWDAHLWTSGARTREVLEELTIL